MKRGVTVGIPESETRKRLIINRHIAKMSPEEIARRFITTYVVPITRKAKSGANSADVRKLAS